jgi:sec-independent protein translocase protein TatA
MGISVWQILIIGIILVLLFGRGKISELMGDVAKGIKSFKKGMAEDEEEAKAESRTIEHNPASTVNTKDAQNSRNA